jgi:hypothetical protein
MINAHSETGQMAVCCQNLMIGALSSHSALCVLVGLLFKKFGLFLNNPRMYILLTLLFDNLIIFLHIFSKFQHILNLALKYITFSIH